MKAYSGVNFSAIGKAKKKKKGIRVVIKLLSVTAWATEMVTVFTAPPPLWVQVVIYFSSLKL